MTPESNLSHSHPGPLPAHLKRRNSETMGGRAVSCGTQPAHPRVETATPTRHGLPLTPSARPPTEIAPNRQPKVSFIPPSFVVHLTDPGRQPPGRCPRPTATTINSWVVLSGSEAEGGLGRFTGAPVSPRLSRVRSQPNPVLLGRYWGHSPTRNPIPCPSVLSFRSPLVHLSFVTLR